MKNSAIYQPPCRPAGRHGAAGKLFTVGLILILILIGVGTALYAFGVLLEGLIEGHLRESLGRWRMDR